MNRISKENYYLNIAQTVLERATCLRRVYGAIIVKNDEIISTGYNGSPRGRKNSADMGFCTREAMQAPRGERYELCRSVHAEANAIISAARSECIGGTIYLAGGDVGTGGLVRAYTSSAKLGLEAAGICDVCERQVMTYALDYTYLAKLQNLAAQDAGGINTAADAGAHSSGDEPAGSGALFTIENLTYTDVVQAALSCVPERADELKNLIANLTGCQGRLCSEETRVVRV